MAGAAGAGALGEGQRHVRPQPDNYARAVQPAVEGLENLPGRGPFIIAPNHVSYLDAFAVAAAFDYSVLRRTYWAGWTVAAFGNPPTRLVSRLAQVVPIDPSRAGLSNLAFRAAVLRRGQNLVWFAEGERSPTGSLQRFSLAWECC